MSCCNCGQPKKLCRCPQKGEAPQRAYIAECTDCDPCRPCESMVKICSFVAPTLTEGQRFRNSFIYNQEDDTVYYIDDSGTPTRFGSSPMFIDNFNPDDRKIPRQTVFDFVNNKAYVYNPEGDYVTIDLASQAKTIHVYVPGGEAGADVISNDNHYAILIDGPWYENDSVEVKDDNGNTISPDTFASLADSLMGTNVIVHVPELTVQYGGASLTIPAGEYKYSVTMTASDALLSAPEDASVVVVVGGGDFTAQICVASGTFGSWYDTKIIIPYSLPE